MTCNDDIQNQQNDQWQCKEESDAGYEEGSLPEGVGLSKADGHRAAVNVRLVAVVGHA